MLLRILVMVTPSLLIVLIPFAVRADVEPEQEGFDDDQDGYETIVVSRKPPLTASEDIIDVEQIQNSAPTSASQILGEVSGLRIVQHGAEGKGHQIFLRGFDASHGTDVEVLLEGVPLNESLHVHGHGYVDLYEIIPEVVGKLIVLKGPFRSSQGDFATAGSVQYELGVPNLEVGMVRTEVSHRGRLRGVLVSRPWDDDGESFLAAEVVYNAGFGPDRESRRAVINGRKEWEIGSFDTIGLFVSGLSSRFESPGAVRLEDVTSGSMGFYDAYGSAGHGISDMGLFRLGWDRDKSGSELEAFVYGKIRRFGLEENYTGQLLDEELGDRRNQLVDSGTGGVKFNLDHRLPITFPLTISAGLGWQLDSAVQQEIHTLDSGATIDENRNLKAAKHHVYARSGLRFSPVWWFEVLPSARMDVFVYDVEDRLNDRSGSESMMGFSPRIMTAFPVHDSLTLFGAYGRGFRSPEARTVTATSVGVAEDVTLAQYRGGSAEISVCDSTELGFSFSPSRALVFQAAWFGTWIEKEIIFDHVSNLNLASNSTRRLGFEAMIKLSPLNWLNLEADATFIDARFVGSGAPVPGTAMWQGKGSLFAGEETGPHGGAEIIWVGQRQLAHGSSVGGFARIDLLAGWRFKSFDVTFVLDNALGTQIMEGAYHYASWFDEGESRSAIPIIHYVAGEPITARLMLTAYL